LEKLRGKIFHTNLQNKFIFLKYAMMKKIVTPVLLAGILATSSGCAKEIPSV
jgi:hypothetical protein